MDSENLGELELAVWRHVADGGGTVAQVAKHFAGTRGLARTTILTVMERLREKKYLTRKRDGKAWRYFTRKPKPELLHAMVRRFMDRAMGGSLDPFMAYLVRDAHVTEAQLQELKQFVEKMEQKNKRKGAPT
jgi:predicted transcriptional regulator